MTRESQVWHLKDRGTTSLAVAAGGPATLSGGMALAFTFADGVDPATVMPGAFLRVGFSAGGDCRGESGFAGVIPASRD